MDSNSIFISGRLTRDAELRSLPSGTALIEFGIASERYYKKQGEAESKKEVGFYDVTCFGKTAEYVSDKIAKGSPVAIEGRLKLDSWEKNGQKHQKVVIVAENIHLIGHGAKNAGQGSN